jgi:hypothetical protein
VKTLPLRHFLLALAVVAVWSSLFALPPLLLAALAIDGWPAIAAGLGKAGIATWAAVAYQSVANTMFGYGVWGCWRAIPPPRWRRCRCWCRCSASAFPPWCWAKPFRPGN